MSESSMYKSPRYFIFAVFSQYILYQNIITKVLKWLAKDFDIEIYTTYLCVSEIYNNSHGLITTAL